MNTTTRKRTMRHPEKWLGRRVDFTKWIVPDGYVRCEFTGKLCRENEALVTFDHWALTRDQRVQLGIWHVEDASWLSDEGYDGIMSLLERAGLYEEYINNAFSL